jgi:hypothetical protein
MIENEHNHKDMGLLHLAIYFFFANKHLFFLHRQKVLSAKYQLRLNPALLFYSSNH